MCHVEEQTDYRKLLLEGKKKKERLEDGDRN